MHLDVCCGWTIKKEPSKKAAYLAKRVLREAKAKATEQAEA